jgi:hypothetical protein
VRATLPHSFQALRGNHYCHLFPELWNEEGLLLEVYVAAAFASWIEFGRTDAVGIPAANEARLTSDVTYSSHMSWRILSRKKRKVKNCDFLLYSTHGNY